jgi:glycine/serine hydroxymethyltransferase
VFDCIALSTAAIVARGLRRGDAAQVAEMVADVMTSTGRNEVIDKVRRRAMALCSRFPIKRGLSQ